MIQLFLLPIFRTFLMSKFIIIYPSFFHQLLFLVTYYYLPPVNSTKRNQFFLMTILTTSLIHEEYCVGFSTRNVKVSGTLFTEKDLIMVCRNDHGIHRGCCLMMDKVLIRTRDSCWLVSFVLNANGWHLQFKPVKPTWEDLVWLSPTQFSYL